MNTELIGTIITAVLTFALGIWKYKDDQKKRKLEIEKLELENLHLRDLTQETEDKLSFYDDVIKMVFYNTLHDAVQELFEKTKVDRYLILIARNGVKDPKFVDVVLDWYKNHEDKIDAVKIYKNIPIDNPYVKMIHDTYHYGFVDLDTAIMQEQILKHYYKTERVNYARTSPITKQIISENKALMIFTSSATHENLPFTDTEKTTIDLYNQGQIKTAITKLLGL